jgi:MFS family permease
MPSPSPALTRVQLERARLGVSIVFIAAGFTFASWVGRAPGVKADLDLDASGLGLLLVCLSIGAMVSMPLTGAVVHNFGPARTVLLGGVLTASGYAFTAMGVWSGSVWLTACALFVAGTGISIWDVAMNVEGAAVERSLHRSIMSKFHAGFSLGTVLGAAVSAAAAAIGIGVSEQTLGTAVVLAASAVVGTRMFTPFERKEAHEEKSRSLLLKAWTNPRTLIVGVMVLAFAFTEGVANDWTAVSFVDGMGTSQAVGALGFAVFVTAMTTGRLMGGLAIDRWGRVAVLRGSVAVAAVGVVLVSAGPDVALMMLGSLLWGFGAALGFPTGMSAAADERAAGIHVSVVSAIGYAAFLAGPPLVGFLGDEFGIRKSQLVVLVALGLALLTSGAARPLYTSKDRTRVAPH